MIASGKLLALTGDEKVLSQLPKGNWIGATTPYFVDDNQGVFTQDKVYVDVLSHAGEEYKFSTYDVTSIDQVVAESYDNGYTILFIPAFTEIHAKYALIAADLDGVFNNAIGGMVAGANLADFTAPKVYAGATLEALETQAVAVHVKLPDNKASRIEILNIFEQDENSVEVQFLEEGFSAKDCLINGEKVNFAQYIKDNNIDIKTPMSSDYTGATINVCFKEVSEENGTVDFYAPVFKDTVYKFSKPVKDYIGDFNIQIDQMNDSFEFSCNCVLNYSYGELEGASTKLFGGPVVFGEIGYTLLNQTLTNLVIDEV